MKRLICYFLLLFLMLGLLVGCSGGGGANSSANTSDSSSTTSGSYPTNLAMASPTSMVSSGGTPVASIPLYRRIKDWAVVMVAAIRSGDKYKIYQALNNSIPVSNAYAGAGVQPEGMNISNFINSVATGSVVPTSVDLDLNSFFNTYVPATCYGPSIFANVPSGVFAGGYVLPGGDTGLQLATNPDGNPCAVAQLNALIKPLKSKLNSTLIFGARMFALAGSNFPASGSSLDLTSQVNTFIQTLLPSGANGTVTSAVITNNNGSYLYKVVFMGTTASNSNLKIITSINHTPGANTNTYSGVASYVAYNGGTCTNQVTNQTGILVDVGTLRYSQSSSTQQDFSSRASKYCISGGSGVNDVTDTLSDYVALTSEGELDPTSINSSFSGSGSGTASQTGWYSVQTPPGFLRFAGSIDPTTYEGNFKFGWQAGTNDAATRMFLANITHNSTEAQTNGVAYFGYANPLTSHTTSTDLAGMYCAWAGTYASHTLDSTKFQSQTFSISDNSSSSIWTLGTSKIAFAPSDSCNTTSGGGTTSLAFYPLGSLSGPQLACLNSASPPNNNVSSSCQTDMLTNSSNYILTYTPQSGSPLNNTIQGYSGGNYTAFTNNLDVPDTGLTIENTIESGSGRQVFTPPSFY